MSNQIRVRQLGLAAFIKLKGVDLDGVENDEFVFTTDISKDEWQIRYSNSCCSTHDAILCDLRKFLSSKKY